MNKTETKTGIVAHRGAWKEFNLLENSIASLKKAIEIGCAGIELDLQMSQDDSILVFHDNTIKEQFITETPFSKVQETKLSNGESIPTFSEFLKEYAQQKGATLFVELKQSNMSSPRKKAFVDKVIAEINAQNLAKHVAYICFDFEICKMIKEIVPQANIQFLNAKDEEKTPELIHAAGLTGIDYHYKQLQANPNWIQTAKRLGLDRNAWTVNEPSDWNFFMSEGFEYITTDYPQALQKHFNDVSANKK